MLHSFILANYHERLLNVYVSFKLLAKSFHEKKEKERKQKEKKPVVSSWRAVNENVYRGLMEAKQLLTKAQMCLFIKVLFMINALN